MNSQEKELWQSRYEQLRQQALEPATTLTQDRWGLSLLIRKGLAGWMRVWRDPVAGAELSACPDRVPLSCPPVSWRQQATLLLANMALSQYQPLAACPV
jgi:hypothetical protein